MAAEAARTLEYLDAEYYGSAAPVLEPYPDELPEYQDVPEPREQAIPKPETEADTRGENVMPGVSLFAIFGTVFAGILMIFVMLAQINYNEIAGDIIRLNNQLGELTEQERKLGISFENVIDMKEVERYARDTLGMSKPDMDQVAVIRSTPVDSAEIVRNNDDTNTLSGLGAFLSSLLDYFR